MNKQELFERISHLPSDCSGLLPMINKLAVLEFIKLLMEDAGLVWVFDCPGIEIEEVE